MSRSEFLRWEKLRLKGKNHVIMRTAILWGAFFFVILNLASWALTGLSLSRYLIPVYPVLGFFTGTFIWWLNEGRFERFLLEKRSRAESRR